MPDYQKMYSLLCAAASDALDLMPKIEENENARLRLTAALLRAEDIYSESDK